MNYLVRWEIDIDAESPEEAATQALIIQRDHDPDNSANHFSVKPEGDPEWIEVDLDVGMPFLKD